MLIILVSFEIFESISITTDVFRASKNSPSNVIALNPDFDKRIAEFRDFAKNTFPNSKVLSFLNFSLQDT